MRKRIFGEVDMFQFDHTHELYAHMNINYIRLDRLPSFDRWGDALEPLARGDYFTTTGEVLLPRVDMSKSTADEVIAQAEVNGRSRFGLRKSSGATGRRRTARRFRSARRPSSGARHSNGERQLPAGMGSARCVGRRWKRGVCESDLEKLKRAEQEIRRSEEQDLFFDNHSPDLCLKNNQNRTPAPNLIWCDCNSWPAPITVLSASFATMRL